MRILLTADPPIPVPPIHYGGIERVVALLADRYRALGHEVALVAHRDSTSAVRRFEWPEPQPRGLLGHGRALLALERAVREFRPDVVHSFARLLYQAWRFLRGTVPVLMCYQRPPTPRTVRGASFLGRERLLFSGCSRFIAAQGARAGGNWVDVPNPVDTNRLRPGSRSPDAPLVFLSRIEAIKGTHAAIRIARSAGIPLVIAGNRVDDAQGRAYWDERVAPEIDGSSVRYVGPVDDDQKASLLGGARALLVPIEWDEPFGIVFAEALACGTPVLSRPRGALPEIVRQGVDGYLHEDDGDLVAAAKRLSDLDPARCRDRAERCFSVEAVADRYLTLLAGLAAR